MYPMLSSGCRVWLALVCLANLVGCSAISSEFRQEVTPELTFQQVIADPRAFIGTTVIWGGTILHTTVHEKGTTLEIIQKPLTYTERPKTTDLSFGRFLVERVDTFLDPEIFDKDREVTVVGTITEERVKKIDEADYRYPLIVAKQLILWPAASMGRGYPYGYYPYYYYPYSFYGRHFYRPHHHGHH